jgi:hypothetical protein
VEINLTSLTVIVGLICLPWSWILRYFPKKDKFADIESWPKKKQNECLKDKLELINTFKFSVLTLPIPFFLISILFKIYVPASFYFIIPLLVLLYINIIDGYFFEKRLYKRLLERISQDNA